MDERRIENRARKPSKKKSQKREEKNGTKKTQTMKVANQSTRTIRNGAKINGKKARYTPEPTWKRGVSTAFDSLFYVAMVVILLGTTLFVSNQDPEKSFFGYRFYSVKTNSMVPQKDSLPGGFYAGDITIVKVATLDQVKAKDIITYRVGENAYLTHRLVKKEGKLNGEEGPFLITKGDANNSEDPPIKADRLVGKVLFVIPKMGGILTFIRSHFIVSIVFFLSIFGFIWVLRMYFDQAAVARKKKKSHRQRMVREN